MGAVPPLTPGQFDIVAIGASTGAPQQLENIFRQLPGDLPMPILIAQHIPPKFTGPFAVQLDRCSALTVVESEDGQPLVPCAGYVGVGKQHMRVRRQAGRPLIEISLQPLELLYKPSADELFTSCAKVYRSRVLAVVMTGLGRDGLQGAHDVVKAGGMVITQSKQSCVVYGMPKACDDANLSTASLNPDEIAATLQQLSATCAARSA